MSIQAITPSQVESVYSGAIGKCCCGCSGNHYHNDGSTSSNHMINRVVKFFNAHLEDVNVDDPEVAWVEISDTRMYVVYLKDGQRFVTIPNRSELMED